MRHHNHAVSLVVQDHLVEKVCIIIAVKRNAIDPLFGSRRRRLGVGSSIHLHRFHAIHLFYFFVILGTLAESKTYLEMDTLLLTWSQDADVTMPSVAQRHQLTIVFEIEIIAVDVDAGLNE